MPEFYILRGRGRVRGPMDRSSAEALIAEGAVDADFEVAEVAPGDDSWSRTFGPLRDHALWRERGAARPAPTALERTGRTTEPVGDARALGVVAADVVVEAAGLDADLATALGAARLDALAALDAQADALGADGVAAVTVGFCELTTADGPVVVCSALGTAVG